MLIKVWVLISNNLLQTDIKKVAQCLLGVDSAIHVESLNGAFQYNPVASQDLNECRLWVEISPILDFTNWQLVLNYRPFDSHPQKSRSNERLFYQRKN